LWAQIKRDFTKDRIDVAIRFGRGTWPDAIVDPLMSEEIQVVCSPKLMEGEHLLTSHAALRHHRLIRHSTRQNSWAQRYRSVGEQPGNLQCGPSLEHFFMIIQAAIAGLGVALLPRFLIEEELKRGTLIAPFKDTVVGPGAYYLVTSAAKAGLPRIKLFRRWMLDQLT